MANSVQTAVMGVSGYAGLELARLLLHHPRLNGTPPVFLGRPDATGEALLTAMHPQLMNNNGAGSLKIEPFSWELLKARGVEVLFLATPHEQSREWAPKALEQGLRVIDLSGAWRLKAASNRAVYQFDDGNQTDEGHCHAVAVQTKAVYGSPELHCEEIRGAQLVANPGCYATSIILALKPLVAAGLGGSGAWHCLRCEVGRVRCGQGSHRRKRTICMRPTTLSAYGVFEHRHTGELLEQLELTDEQIVFTPHLLPIPRGILSTIYLRFTEKRDPQEIEARFREFYASSPLVRISAPGQLPQIQYSVRTNYCDIGFVLNKDGRRCVIVSCLDNLLKGAAGQAVENLNLMCGWGEAEGLA